MQLQLFFPKSQRCVDITSATVVSPVSSCSKTIQFDSANICEIKDEEGGYCGFTYYIVSKDCLTTLIDKTQN